MSSVKEAIFKTLKGKKAQSEKKAKKPIWREKLESWLNKSFKIEMSDGRILIGNFLCTDRDANVILGACTEFLNPEVCGFSDEPRILGLVMVPGKHIVSIHLEVHSSHNNNSNNQNNNNVEPGRARTA